MILGTHNSMTYLPPSKWWMYLLRFTAKCQRLDFKQQYEAGVRFFDLRLIFKYRGVHLDKPLFCHGPIVYDSSEADIFFVLEWLNSRIGSKVYVRFLLEKGDDTDKECFARWCSHVEEFFENICFTEARAKNGWAELYRFKGGMPCSLVDRYASCNRSGVNRWKGLLRSKNWSGLLIDDVWPWIYARLHNRKNYATYKDMDVVLLLDFIDRNLTGPGIV